MYTVFPVIMSNQKINLWIMKGKKIIIPANKDDYLLASYKSELAFEAQDPGFSVQHPVKLAS